MVLAIGLPASAGITLRTPKTRQIVQRNQDNTGSFTNSGVASALTNLDRIEARFVIMPGATNNGVSTDWVVLVNSATNGDFSGIITNISAGGGYRLIIETTIMLAAEFERQVVKRTHGRTNPLGRGLSSCRKGQSLSGAIVVFPKVFKPAAQQGAAQGWKIEALW